MGPGDSPHLPEVIKADQIYCGYLPITASTIKLGHAPWQDLFDEHLGTSTVDGVFCSTYLFDSRAR